MIRNRTTIESNLIENLRPRQINEDFDKTREDIADISLKECRRTDWSRHKLEYRNPHRLSQFQREN
jgi:hypothetical protein